MLRIVFKFAVDYCADVRSVWGMTTDTYQIYSTTTVLDGKVVILNATQTEGYPLTADALRNEVTTWVGNGMDRVGDSRRRAATLNMLGLPRTQTEQVIKDLWCMGITATINPV